MYSFFKIEIIIVKANFINRFIKLKSFVDFLKGISEVKENEFKNKVVKIEMNKITVTVHIWIIRIEKWISYSLIPGKYAEKEKHFI